MKKLLFTLILLVNNISYGVEPIKVAVIDTGLDLEDIRFKSILCKSGHRDITNTSIVDIDGHGTHVAGLILQNAPSYGWCLMIVKFFDARDSGKMQSYRLAEGIASALENNASIINISAGGRVFQESEYILIKEHPKVKFIVAAGNESSDITKSASTYFPASLAVELSNIFPVGALNKRGQRLQSSNYGFIVTSWEIGEDVLSYFPCKVFVKSKCFRRLTGTSMSTGIHTGKVILDYVK